jgi:hypothetical protein
MSTFKKVSVKMANDHVAYRKSWGMNRFIFNVAGATLEKTFYENYGTGVKVKGDVICTPEERNVKLKGPDDIKLMDTICFVDLHSATFGWQPTQEDLDADDWFAKRK